MPAEYLLNENAFPGILLGASVADRQIVRLAPTGSQERAVQAVATRNEPPFGITAARANPNDAVTIYTEGAAPKVRAAASIGVGAPVGLSTVGTTSFGLVAAASGSVVYQVGETVTPALAGEYMTILIKPRQLSGSA